MKTMYLVDASNMFYRAFFAVPPLTNDKGMPTNALYGFLSMSMKLLRDVKPDCLVYCFDQKEPSFRNDLFADYKANRDEMPDDLKPQIPYLKLLAERLGVAQVERARYEADDVIGSLALQASRQGLEVVIVSGDKDFAQLVRPGISLYDTMKDLRTDVQGVKDKFGVRPDQIVDYLAMVGDTSDNVPGVRGIGPKGAQKLLGEFDTLEGVYANLYKIKGATHTKLVEGRESAFLAQKLVTIVTDLAFDVPLEQLRIKPIDSDALRTLLLELGFKSFERKMFADVASTAVKVAASDASSAPPQSEAAPKRTKKVVALEKWVEVECTADELRQQVDPYSEVWGLLSERGLYIATNGKVFRVASTDAEISAALAHKHLKWKGFDVKQVLKALNLHAARVVWDSLLAAYVIRANMIGDFTEVYSDYCGKTLPDFATPLDHLQAHVELEAVLRESLRERQGEFVLEKFDLPLVSVLADMELKGFRIDVEELKSQSQSLLEDIRRLEQQIHSAAGESFNIGSPKQLANILFEKLKLPPTKKTKTGYSTDSDVLESLASQHVIAKLIVEYRELTKLKNTYVDALPALCSNEDGRVHTRLNQAATTTGRLSSTNPNLQNIPIRTERGRLVRRAFVAAPGYCLISADYSQIELRILAHIADDPGLKKSFLDDLDIHAATASEIFGTPLNSVTPQARRVAKAVNFGIAYGQGAFGLAETLGIPRGEATQIIQRYFEKFRGVKAYMEQTVRDGIERGYVSTLFGRRRYIEELKSSSPMIRRAGERAAINAPIQGTASDLVKLAMLEVHRSLPISMLLQVHDELLFECPIEDAKLLAAEIKSMMESVYQLSVPLKVNVGFGNNWDNAH